MPPDIPSDHLREPDAGLLTPVLAGVASLVLIAIGVVVEAYHGAALAGSGAMLVGGALGVLQRQHVHRLGLCMVATLALLTAPQIGSLGDDALFANACALVALWMGSALARGDGARTAARSEISASHVSSTPPTAPAEGPAMPAISKPDKPASPSDSAHQAAASVARVEHTEPLSARLDALVGPDPKKHAPRLMAARPELEAPFPIDAPSVDEEPFLIDVLSAAGVAPAGPTDADSGGESAVAANDAMTAADNAASGSSGDRAWQDKVPLPMCLLDADGHLLTMNAALRAIAHGAPATAGQHFDGLFDADDAPFARMHADISAGLRRIQHATLVSGPRMALHAQRDGAGFSVQCVPLAHASESLRLRALSAHADDITLVLDAASRIVSASEQAASLLGSSRTSLRSRPLLDHVHRVDQQRLNDALQAAHTTPHVPHAPGRLRLVGGAGDVVEVTATFTDYPQTPGINGIVVNLHDVTATAAMERALREHEDRFAALFHASPEPMVVFARDDRIVLDVNRACCELLGASRADTIGVRLEDLPGFDNAGLTAHLARLDSQVAASDSHVELQLPGGQTHLFNVASHLFEHGGELATLMFLRDPARPQPAEAAALRESEERFTRVFRAVPDAILITRLSDHVVIDANDRCCEAGGFAREEVIGRGSDEIGLFDGTDVLDRTRSLLEHYGSYRDIEATLTAPEGPLPVLLSATIVELAGEACAVTICRDLRPQLAAENALRASEERFRSAFANAPMGFALVNADLTVATGNVCLADMLGATTGELAGRSLLDLFVAGDRAELAMALADAWSGKAASIQREQRIQRGDGRERITTLHAVAQRDDAGTTQHIILQLADITDIRQSQQQMERLAFYDALTDLANRRLLMDRLGQTAQHAARQATPSALLYLDLDKFKRINDTFGHDIGDDLLKTVADRLRRCVRRDDTVARIGGDEFTILLHDVRDAEGAAVVAEHVLDSLREPVHAQGQVLDVTTSIGIAMIPDDGSDPATLLQHADQAMYRAKQQGRNTFRFFGDAINARAAARLNIESALERAVSRNELKLFYQSVVRLEDGSIDSIEALLRWQHPERGLIEPAGFLSLSDRIGLILSLDTWALGEGIRQLADLDRAGLHVPAIAINISLASLREEGLAANIRTLLSRHGIEPHRLQLEIAEGYLTRDLDRIEGYLAPLRDLGVTLTLDDFGSGLTSLAAIAHLPVQRVKLHGSLVTRLTSSREAMAIVDNVVTLCNTLGRETIGESVETLEQRLRLARSGCRFGQGYLFGTPGTAIELAASLSRHVPHLLVQAGG